MTQIIWKVQKLDLGIASVRIRTLEPAMLLRERGHAIHITASCPDSKEIGSADVVIVNKSYSDADVKLCQDARAMNKRLLVDFCVDLSEESRSSELQSFRKQAQLANRLVTTGPELASRVKMWLGEDVPIETIPDIAEDMTLLDRVASSYPPTTFKQGARIYKPSGLASFARWATRIERPYLKNRRRLVWFGNAGGAGSGAGLETLEEIAGHLEAVNRTVPIQLVVVTRGYNEFRRVTKPFGFPCLYREWSLLGAPGIISECEVCILPNHPTDFARARSSNRCLLALNCGVPVVATSIPSIQPLSDCIVLDDWKEGILKYLTDKEHSLRHVTRGQDFAKTVYGPSAIANAWERLLT